MKFISMAILPILAATLALPAVASPVGIASAVSANNSLGLQLAREASQEKPGKNFLISPLSLHLALSMAANGTAGTTRKELLRTMNFPESVEALNNGNSLLIGSLAYAKKETDDGLGPNPPVVAISNGAWHTNGAGDGRRFAFSKNFLQGLAAYDAESGAMDFTDPSAAKRVNSWAEEKTYGLIPSIIDADSLREMLWVILNATYFEGSWEHGFHKSGPRDFYPAAGRKTRTEMVSATGYYRRSADREKEILELPFYSPGEAQYAFYLVLPNSSSYEAVEAKIWDRSFWEGVIRGQGVLQYGSLTMPKFSFDYGVELKQDSAITRSLGLGFLFSDYADFSAMEAPGSLRSKVGLIKQNSRIELDEHGVKAAAVTLVGGIERSSAPPREQFRTVADRPYYFAIADKKSGALLFVGSLRDPR
jgi:serine protease inhibitor